MTLLSERIGNESAGLQRLRGERVERSFAHMYETGRMRRTHLRGHSNILKRLLIHASAFNLACLLRKLVGMGTPRGLQGRTGLVLRALLRLYRAFRPLVPCGAALPASRTLSSRRSHSVIVRTNERPSTTGC